MSDKFRNKYRTASTRLQNWDYGWNAAYFVTICTKNRTHHFGEISNGEMVLSKTGVIADVLWYEMKNHAKNIELDAFVVMPNHVHGIVLILNLDMANTQNANPETDDNIDIVETTHALSLRSSKPPPPETQPELTPGQKRFQNQQKHPVIHHWIVQIRRYQTRPPAGIRFLLAATVL